MAFEAPPFVALEYRMASQQHHDNHSDQDKSYLRDLQKVMPEVIDE
jgi:hypothetical protein